MTKGLPTITKERENNEAAVVTKEITVIKAAIEVPLLHGMDEGYASNHAYLRLNQQQTLTVNRLRLAATNANQKLNNGKSVQTATDALLWLIEEIARKDKKPKQS